MVGRSGDHADTREVVMTDKPHLALVTSGDAKPAKPRKPRKAKRIPQLLSDEEMAEPALDVESDMESIKRLATAIWISAEWVMEKSDCPHMGRAIKQIVEEIEDYAKPYVE